MKKAFFNSLKNKRKKYAKFVFCYSLASTIALTQSFPSFALSTDESQTSQMEDTISSVIDSVKKSNSPSESATAGKTKEIISSEDNTLNSTSTTSSKADSSTKNEEGSKNEENNSKDDKGSKENEENSEENKDSKEGDETSKNNKDSKENEESSKDVKDSEEDTESSEEDKDSKEDDSTSDDSTDSTKSDNTSDTTVDSSTTESVTETEAYETIEDIEIATEDPSEYDDNELLVQFKTDINEKRVQEIADKLPETTLESYSDGIAVFTAQSKTIIEEDIAILSTIQEISIIQPNYKYSFSSFEEGEEIDELEDTVATYSLPNDTFFSKQWGLYNKASSSSNLAQTSSSSSGIDIDVLNAWKNFQSNNEVIVAVIDTGVDYQHKDLKDHMWYNKAELDGTNGVDDDNNGYKDDIYGWDFYNDDATICHYSGTSASKKDNDNHGTRCAGIIAATANNNFGIAGVASNVNVKIMSLKTAGGPNAEGDTANIIKAIKYASYNGAKICNASWNCDSDDPALKLAISESNMLFICSAGNGYGTNIDYEPSYPCSYNLNNTVGVTSIDPDGTLSYFSNFGKETVSMAAPGSNICSTIVGKYGYDSGTSMAAPFVTGVAAMLYAYDSTLYPARAKSLLLESTKSLSALKNKVATNGIINASLAISKIQGKEYTEDKTPPTIKSTIIPRKNGAYLSVSVTDKGGSHTRVQRYAYGKLSTSFFKNGEKGKVLTSGVKPFVTTQGYYTIYAQDNAGNETVKVINVKFDKTAPSLSLSYKKSGKKYNITIKSSDSASGLSEVRYAKSKHSASYLKSKGTKLSSFNNTKTITVSSEGVYSFYAKDKAGNSVVKTITLDKTPPSLSLSYKRSGKQYKITVKASDSVSGLSEVRYAKYNHSAAYLKSKGTKLTSFNKTKTITVSSKNTYSFYAKDKAGNTVVKTIKIK